jgi:hypothetical protein
MKKIIYQGGYAAGVTTHSNGRDYRFEPGTPESVPDELAAELLARTDKDFAEALPAPAIEPPKSETPNPDPTA